LDKKGKDEKERGIVSAVPQYLDLEIKEDELEGNVTRMDG